MYRTFCTFCTGNTQNDEEANKHSILLVYYIYIRRFFLKAGILHIFLRSIFSEEDKFGDRMSFDVCDKDYVVVRNRKTHVTVGGTRFPRLAARPV
jgi:hypothetical protein